MRQSSPIHEWICVHDLGRAFGLSRRQPQLLDHLCLDCLVVMLLMTAAAVPLGAYFLAPLLASKTIELHAHMPENGG